MNRFSLTIFLIFVISIGYSQQKWFSGSFLNTSQYYVDDSELGDFPYEDRFRSNNYLKLNGFYKKFTFGLQVEGYYPEAILEFPKEFDKEIGISTFYANYKSKNIDFTLGYFYEQFGNGLIFRSWEERELGINNSIFGGKFIYSYKNYLEFSVLYGKHKYGFDFIDSPIFGINSEISISELFKFDSTNLNLGISYLSKSEEITEDEAALNLNKTIGSFSGRINFSEGNIYSNIEYVYKGKDPYINDETFYVFVTEKQFSGNAFQFNLGYSVKGFGIDATFRRLENMTFYSKRILGNSYNQGLVNYLPALTKQHDYSLTNIYIYQTQANLSFKGTVEDNGYFSKAGEIGAQFDVFYKIKKGTPIGGKYGTNVAFNFSFLNGLDAEYDYVNKNYSSTFFGFGKSYFSDINLEITKKWSKRWSSILMASKIYFNKELTDYIIEKLHTDVLVVEATYKFSPKKSMRVDAQHLWTDDDKKNWWAATVEFNLSPKISFFTTDMYNYENDANKIHYYNFGGSFTKNSTRIALNYGRQRGGLVCAGGVCRFVPESTGFGLMLSTSF